MAFVTFGWAGIERSLPKEDALALATELRARVELRPDADELAGRIDEEARAGTFETSSETILLDENDQREIGAAVDRLDRQGALTLALHSLQVALRGERRLGEPGY